MKFKLLILVIVFYMNEIKAEDNFFAAIYNKMDRYALSVFDNVIHKSTLYLKTMPEVVKYFQGVGTWIEDLDDWWSSVANFLVTLPEENYDPKLLLHEQKYLELAKYAKYKLYTEFSDQKRLIYHFGMRNSWDFWYTLDSLLGVLFEQRIYENKPDLTDTFLTDKFLTVGDLKNFMAWRGVSGSDDIEWAGLGLVAAYRFTKNPVFLDKEHEWNGARGCKQLYSEIYEDFYDFEHGGIYWDTNRHYKGSISNSLWVLWSAEMYEATGEKKYLDEALKVQDWIVNKGKVVLKSGTVYDGFSGATNDFKHVTRDVWSYNFGTFLGAVSEFYQITNDVSYMKTGQHVVNNAFWHFNKTGIFSDHRKYNSDGDAFKGIFFKYLSKFLVQYWKSTPKDDLETRQWILTMKDYTLKMAHIVVNYKMDEETGLFSAYWDPNEMMKLTPAAQVTAMDLFLAAHRVNTYIK